MPALRAMAEHHVDMAAHVLAPSHVAALERAPFNYEPVGATAHEVPHGYESFSRSQLLVRRDYASAAEDLMAWRVHEQAGLTVAASRMRVEEGTVVLLRLGLGALAVRAPCRVVYVLDEPRRKGFAYGTLPGHPEAGEELFLLEQSGDDQLTFTITAFSRHVSALAKIGGRLTRRVQQAVTSRYLRGLDRLGH
jgi:uncharacterized protein (UPF0548 family)